MKSHGLELLGSFSVPSVSVLPSNSEFDAQLIYLTTNHHLYYANNGAWIDLYEFGAARINSVNASAITGVINAANLPTGLSTGLVVTATQITRFLLTISDVSLGNSVLQVDTNQLYYVVDLDHLDSEAGYSSVSSKLSRINITDTSKVLTLSDCDGTKILTNHGAIDPVLVYLPDGQDGLRVNAIVATQEYMRFQAKPTEYIRYLTTLSIQGGYITTEAIGSQLQLDWVANGWMVSIVGENWYIETS